MSVAAAADYPARDFPSVRLWSESYAWWSWDEANDVSLYAHFQRHPDKPSLWRASIALSRSDGVYALSTYGPQRAPDGPGFDSLHITIEKPHQRWRLRVDAGAHYRSLAAHQSGPLTGGPAAPLSIDLVMDFHSPLWSLTPDQAKATMVSSEHYEQTGVVTGEITLGTERFSVNALGANDHSRGVRDLGTLATGGFFLPATFPGGRALCASKSSAAPDAHEIGYLSLGDGHLAQSHKVSPPKHWPTPGQRDEIVVETEAHTARLVITPTQRRVYVSITPPTFEQIGLASGADTPIYYCDWTCRVEWDGEIGYGSLQMLRKL